jgi:hypothetical protein
VIPARFFLPVSSSYFILHTGAARRMWVANGRAVNVFSIDASLTASGDPNRFAGVSWFTNLLSPVSSLATQGWAAALITTSQRRIRDAWLRRGARTAQFNGTGAEIGDETGLTRIPLESGSCAKQRDGA